MEQQCGQGQPGQYGGNDLIRVSSAERRCKCRERDARHQQRFRRPQPPTPTSARTCDIDVRFVIVDDLIERQAKMVVQGQLKHGSPFSASLPAATMGELRASKNARAATGRSFPRRELQHAMKKVLGGGRQALLSSPPSTAPD